MFMETHMNPRRRQHMVLECIPLPRELGDMAPIYFKVRVCVDSDHSFVQRSFCLTLGKSIVGIGVSLVHKQMCECPHKCVNTTVSVCLQKAIMECDEEWAMNKKIVDLSSKDIRHAVCSFVFSIFLWFSFLFVPPTFSQSCLTCFFCNLLSFIFPLSPFCSCTLSFLLIVINCLFNAF